MRNIGWEVVMVKSILIGLVGLISLKLGLAFIKSLVNLICAPIIHIEFYANSENRWNLVLRIIVLNIQNLYIK